MPISRIDEHRFHTRRAKSTYNRIEEYFLAAAWQELGLRCDWNSGKILAASA
jgi:hypothetical protein